MSTEEMVYNVHSMKYVDTLHIGQIRGKVGFLARFPPMDDVLKITLMEPLYKKKRKVLGVLL